MMTKQIPNILSTFFFLTKIADCYDGPVASIFHRYPGSDSFVNINFNEPGHSQVRVGNLYPVRVKYQLVFYHLFPLHYKVHYLFMFVIKYLCVLHRIIFNLHYQVIVSSHYKDFIEEEGSKIFQYCVTSFMDDPLIFFSTFKAQKPTFSFYQHPKPLSRPATVQPQVTYYRPSNNI